MSDQHHFATMDERLRNVAPAFRYPPTPDIAGSVRQRLAGANSPQSAAVRPRPRFAWTLAALSILLILATLLTVPEVQGFVRSIFRIGVIEVVVATPVPTPVSTTPGPSPTASRPLNLVGETTLAFAAEHFPLPIRLPSYPSDLGKPDRVFMQDFGGPALILTWHEPGRKDQARLVLYEISSLSQLLEKSIAESKQLQETKVNGKRAAWVRGPHWLQFYDIWGFVREEARRLVDGDVLIWEEDDVTYRLETTLPLEEAVRIAESLETPQGIETPISEIDQTPPEWTRNLVGATTLEEARKRVTFPIRWPAYPRYIDDPDLVFVQERASPMVVLAWYSPGQRDRVGMLLYQMVAGPAAKETFAGGQLLAEASVHGHPARWVATPHLLTFYDEGGAGNIDSQHHIPGHALMWEEDGVAYRLEIPLFLADALQVAESLR